MRERDGECPRHNQHHQGDVREISGIPTGENDTGGRNAPIGTAIARIPIQLLVGRSGLYPRPTQQGQRNGKRSPGRNILVRQ